MFEPSVFTGFSPKNLTIPPGKTQMVFFWVQVFKDIPWGIKGVCKNALPKVKILT